jgi:hypothetical protein
VCFSSVRWGVLRHWSAGTAAPAPLRGPIISPAMADTRLVASDRDTDSRVGAPTEKGASVRLTEWNTESQE